MWSGRRELVHQLVPADEFGGDGAAALAHHPEGEPPPAPVVDGVARGLLVPGALVVDGRPRAAGRGEDRVEQAPVAELREVRPADAAARRHERHRLVGPVVPGPRVVLGTGQPPRVGRDGLVQPPSGQVSAEADEGGEAELGGLVDRLAPALGEPLGAGVVGEPVPGDARGRSQRGAVTRPLVLPDEAAEPFEGMEPELPRPVAVRGQAPVHVRAVGDADGGDLRSGEPARAHLRRRVDPVQAVVAEADRPRRGTRGHGCGGRDAAVAAARQRQQKRGAPRPAGASP